MRQLTKLAHRLMVVQRACGFATLFKVSQSVERTTFEIEQNRQSDGVRGVMSIARDRVPDRVRDRVRSSTCLLVSGDRNVNKTQPDHRVCQKM